MASNAVAAFNAAASEPQVVDIGARPVSALAAITPRSLKDLLEMGRMLVASGLMPEGVTKPEAAAAIVLKGIELDVPPMAAIEGISIIKGKPACGAHLMIGLIKRKHGGGAIRVTETTSERAVVQYREPGWGDVREFAFTIEDATRAGLDQGVNWKRYPAAMLRARAISAVAKMAFADVAFGLLLPDELGVDVEVTEDGDVRIVDAAVVQPRLVDEGDPAIEGMVADKPPRPRANVITKDDLDALRGEPEAADAADSETGELLEDPPEEVTNTDILDEIERLRGRLRWTKAKVSDRAAMHGINLNSRKGGWWMVNHLSDLVEMARRGGDTAAEGAA